MEILQNTASGSFWVPSFQYQFCIDGQSRHCLGPKFTKAIPHRTGDYIRSMEFVCVTS